MFPRIAGLAGQPQAIRISKRDTQELSLGTGVTAHAGISVRGACFTRIGREALRPKAVYAVGAETTANMCRHGNAVVDPYVHDVASDTLDDAKRFMADHHPFAATEAPFVDMQIGAANRGGR